MSPFFKKVASKIIIDVDTQANKLPTKPEMHPEAFYKNIRRIMAWSRVHKHNVVSTTLVKEEINYANDLQDIVPESYTGHRKLRYSTLANNICYSTSCNTDLPADLLQKYQQVIFEKMTIDPFQHPKADRLFTNIKFDEIYLIGTSAETSMLYTGLGLLLRNKNVFVVIDAICGEAPESTALEIRKIIAKGGKSITTEELIGKKSRLVGTPSAMRVKDIQIKAHI
jgi:nicotinamidase-related amidase